MKKHLTFFPLALLFVFSACTADINMNDKISEEDGDILSYRMYIEPFAGNGILLAMTFLLKPLSAMPTAPSAITFKDVTHVI